MFTESFGEKVIGELACLFEPVDTVGNLEVNPTIVCVLGQIVFIDELLRDVGESNTNVFWSVKRCAKIEVGDIVACKARLRG